MTRDDLYWGDPVDDARLQPAEQQARDHAHSITTCRLCGKQSAVTYLKIPAGQHYRYPSWANQEEDRRRLAAGNAWLDEHRQECPVLLNQERLLDLLKGIETAIYDGQ